MGFYFIIYVFTCTCSGFHPGRVEPASTRASTAPRSIAAHVRRSRARSHEIESQSRFHRRRPTTWGPDSTARSSLIVLAHVFSCSPTPLRRLGRERGGGEVHHTVCIIYIYISGLSSPFIFVCLMDPIFALLAVIILLMRFLSWSVGFLVSLKNSFWSLRIFSVFLLVSVLFNII